ncbi:MAG TPA: hydrogenase nickel incorporation protein HypA [Spirochaetia bacterium]|nr:hydrogenase nickel incorporation protein HypA [Spirochaetia bacterium]
MHEWALADAVVEATSSALAGKDPACLRGVTVQIGELQAIDREIFSFALETILAEKPYSPNLFHVETERASFLCSSCGKEWGLDDSPGLGASEKEAIHFLPEAAHAFMRCPSCASPDYRVQKGRGVKISGIELADRGGCT